MWRGLFARHVLCSSNPGSWYHLKGQIALHVCCTSLSCMSGTLQEKRPLACCSIAWIWGKSLRSCACFQRRGERLADVVLWRTIDQPKDQPGKVFATQSDVTDRPLRPYLWLNTVAKRLSSRSREWTLALVPLLWWAKFCRAASQMICRAPGWRFLDSSCTQRASWRVKRQSHSWRRRRSHGTVWARLTLECRCQRQYRCFPASWWSQTLWIACSFWELAVLGRCKAVVAPPHRSWSTCAILSRKAASERGSESYYACRRDLSGDSYNQ